MIKYKVKDIANDLGVSNKKISEILQEHCGVTKKTMATLEEHELDVIFDVITKENSVNNFDKYFAARNKKIEENLVREAKKEVKKDDKKPADKKENKKKDSKTDKKPQKANNNVKTKQDKKPDNAVEIKSEDDTPSRKRRVIDTRATNVDVERYNSKYDDLASESSKMRSTDNTVKKQKFTNRSQRQKGRRQKRETEAERLKRIALERKQKPITVQIPDEIVVSELATRLKATVAEVVKRHSLWVQ